jgi:hypothetical protein
MRLCNHDAYKGGGCLELTGTTQEGGVLCYKLFSTVIKIPNTLTVEYVYKITAGSDIDLFLEMKIVKDNLESSLVINGPSAVDKDGIEEKVSNRDKEYGAAETCINGWCKR